MSDPAASPAEKAQRCAAILGELTELGLTLARDLHARALAAETAQEAQALGLAFQRVSRSVRQCLALDARMEREAKAQAQEAESRARTARVARECEHKVRVGVAMNRLLWTEAQRDRDDSDDDEDEDAEDEAFEALNNDLTARLDEAALAEDFLETPVPVLAARFAADMGLTAEAAIAPPPPAPPPAAPPPPALSPAYPYGSDAWAAGHAPPNST